jgi:hypothetical protein
MVASEWAAPKSFKKGFSLADTQNEGSVQECRQEGSVQECRQEGSVQECRQEGGVQDSRHKGGLDKVIVFCPKLVSGFL